MNLKESIRRILKEETKIPIYILRRLDFSNISDQMKDGALRKFNKNESLDDIIDKASRYVAYELMPWEDPQGDEIPENDYEDWVETLKEYIFHKYGEEAKEYVKRVTPDDIFNNDGNKYVFYKHSEQNGGNGFSESFDTWGDLILRYGWWFPLDWDEIKSNLDKMDEGKKIILKPNDKHNTYGYYFSIIKKNPNLRENIKRTLKEEEENKFNPVRFFYEQYLNQQPLYFEDLMLHPTYDGTKIMWNVENPNDRSFNYNVLDGFIGDEFRTFCAMINGDYQKYDRFVRGFYDRPRDRNYLNDGDKSKINQILKNKKEYRFETDSNMFFIDLDYKSFEITTYSDEIDFYGYFNFNKIYKYDSHGNNEEIITRREFFNDFEDIIDYWIEGLYSFFDEVLLVLTSNTAFYDNDYDYFNLNLE
jgi:hypothetical protein